MRSLGDLVVLRHGRGYGCGINSLVLFQHGIVNDEPVEIVKITTETYNPTGNLNYAYQVIMPDGHPLDIDEIDINKLATERLDEEPEYAEASHEPAQSAC